MGSILGGGGLAIGGYGLVEHFKSKESTSNQDANASVSTDISREDGTTGSEENTFTEQTLQNQGEASRSQADTPNLNGDGSSESLGKNSTEVTPPVTSGVQQSGMTQSGQSDVVGSGAGEGTQIAQDASGSDGSSNPAQTPGPTGTEGQTTTPTLEP